MNVNEALIAIIKRHGHENENEFKNHVLNWKPIEKEDHGGYCGSRVWAYTCSDFVEIKALTIKELLIINPEVTGVLVFDTYNENPLYVWWIEANQSERKKELIDKIYRLDM